MKKKLCFFILFCSIVALEIKNIRFFPVLAINPIIIDKAIYGPPQGTGKDQDYHSNIPTNAIKCPGTVEVSQTFEPKEASGTPIPYPVNSVSATYDANDNYTNMEVDNSIVHTDHIYKSSDPDLINLARNSLNTDNPNGTGGLDRSITYSVLQCLKSHRLIYAILSLIPDPKPNLTYHDEQVGWLCPDKFYLLAEKAEGIGCTSVRLSDIASSLKSNIFYDTATDCYSDPLPSPGPLPVTAPHPHMISIDLAQTLYNTFIKPADDGSLASIVEVCDKDASGADTNCRQQEQLIPGGNHLVTSSLIYQKLIPFNQTKEQVNLCQTNTYIKSKDQPNPISLLATITKFFGTITTQAETFVGVATVNHYIDSRVQDGVNTVQTALNNFLPMADQQQFNTTSTQGSSTDGKNVDPGNPVARTVFGKDFLPKDF